MANGTVVSPGTLVDWLDEPGWSASFDGPARVIDVVALVLAGRAKQGTTEVAVLFALVVLVTAETGRVTRDAPSSTRRWQVPTCVPTFGLAVASLTLTVVGGSVGRRVG